MYLQVNRRKFKCDNCRKPFSEELDFVASKRTYTKRLAENILEQLKEGDILNVSRRNDVTEEEIQRMIEDIAEEITEPDLSELKRHCAVLVNLDTGKLIAILEKRTQEELRKTLTGWGKEVLEQIEEVSIDPETLNPVIKLYIDKHNTPITSNFKLNRQSSGTSVHS